MHEIAHAKLNLALHVRGREPDGYHRLETLFAFCEAGDHLHVTAADTLELELAGPFAGALDTGADNLVMRAAEALRQRFGVTRGAALVLDKKLPVAAGIGGGSADAAAALRLLSRFWQLGATDAELLDLAASLGSDVPACVRSRTARGEGRGERLTEQDVPDLAGACVLLVNPRVPVSTAEVFRRWDGIDQGPLRDWQSGRNDLLRAAVAVAPAIHDVLQALSDDANVARMSGSGATCFGLYAGPRERDAAAARIGALHPHYWCLATRLL